MSTAPGPGPRVGPGPERSQHEQRMWMGILLCWLLVMLWMHAFQAPPQPTPTAPLPAVQPAPGPADPGQGDPRPAAPGQADPQPQPLRPDPRPAPAEPAAEGELAALPATGPSGLVIENDELRVRTDQQGGLVRGVWLKKHGRYGVPRSHAGALAPEDWLPLFGWDESSPAFRLVPLDYPELARPDRAAWTGERIDATTARWQLRYAHGLVLTRSYHLDGRSLRCEINLANEGSRPITASWEVQAIPGVYREGDTYDDVRVLLYPGDSARGDFRTPRTQDLDGLVAATRAALPKGQQYPLEVADERLSCAALAEKYFAMVLHVEALPGPCRLGAVAVPAEPPPHVLRRSPERIASYYYDRSIAVALSTQQPVALAPGEHCVFAQRLEAGPGEVLEQRPYVGELAHYGMFGPISRTLLQLLRWFSQLFGSYGWAIVGLTVAVKVLMHPLTRRQQISMHHYQEQMKKFQPELEALKKKYAKNPQKQQEEMLLLFKKHKVQPIPVGGCLPIFVQMPIFIGLFYGLSYSILLRQQPFLWMADLAQPDRLMEFATPPPLIGMLIGRELNLLPILMTIVWVIQQRMMPLPPDETMAQQAKMMRWMPIMFGFMLYHFASGLCLYWFASNLIGIIEQKLIKAEIERRKLAADAVPPASPAVPAPSPPKPA